MKINTEEITSVIKQEIEQFSSDLEISEVGRVVEVGDGIARIYGLSRAMSSELLEFDTEEGAIMRVEATMAREQIAEAQRMAREWLAKHQR